MMDMIMDGQSDSAVHMLRRLPGVDLYRYDFHLDENHLLMDDAGEGNLAYLRRKAEKIMSENKGDLERLCRRL